MSRLQAEHIERALSDANAEVRRSAVRLGGARLEEHPELLEALLGRVGDAHVRVRFQLAAALGASPTPRATAALIDLARGDGEQSWFQQAILSASERRSGAIVSALVQDDHFVSSAGDGRMQLVRELATVVGVRGDLGELHEVLEAIGAAGSAGMWWQTALLSGLARGLPRHQGDLGRTSLAALSGSPPPELAEPMEAVRAVLARCQTTALDGGQPLPDRLAAIDLLGYQSFAETAEAYDRLLSARQPVAVQRAALEAMQGGAERAAEIILKHWPTLGPDVRGRALSILLRRGDTTRMALAAMADGRVNPAVIGIDQRVRLLRHGDAAIQSLARKLFGGAISANRREVAEKYRPALTMDGSREEGAKVFQKSCAKCHKVDGVGHEVGPDISDVRNRSREALLYDILDPNRKLEPRFTDYVVALDDGRVFNGLMVAESADAVILAQPEGKREVIPRSQIEAMRASGKSLMPEGVEKEITVEQMAHLLEFLKR